MFRQLKWVWDRNRDQIYKTATRGSFSTQNCVYLITCRECGRRYVGETGLTLRVRFTCHKYNINNNKNMDRHVVRHFIQHGWDAVQVCVLESNPHWTTARRRRVERDWIHKLGTRYPQGLNERLYFRP